MACEGTRTRIWFPTFSNTNVTLKCLLFLQPIKHSELKGLRTGFALQDTQVQALHYTVPKALLGMITKSDLKSILSKCLCSWGSISIVYTVSNWLQVVHNISVSSLMWSLINLPCFLSLSWGTHMWRQWKGEEILKSQGKLEKCSCFFFFLMFLFDTGLITPNGTSGALRIQVKFSRTYHSQMFVIKLCAGAGVIV